MNGFKSNRNQKVGHSSLVLSMTGSPEKRVIITDRQTSESVIVHSYHCGTMSERNREDALTAISIDASPFRSR